MEVIRVRSAEVLRRRNVPPEDRHAKFSITRINFILVNNHLQDSLLQHNPAALRVWAYFHLRPVKTVYRLRPPDEPPPLSSIAYLPQEELYRILANSFTGKECEYSLWKAILIHCRNTRYHSSCLIILMIASQSRFLFLVWTESPTLLIAQPLRDGS